MNTSTMLTVNAALWVLAVLCFALAVILPFTGGKNADGTDRAPINAGPLNLIALGLLFASLTRLAKF